MLSAFTGFRTLICAVLFLILNDPTVGAFLAAHIPAFVVTGLNTLIGGVGLKYLNDKVNTLKPA